MHDDHRAGDAAVLTWTRVPSLMADRSPTGNAVRAMPRTRVARTPGRVAAGAVRWDGQEVHPQHARSRPLHRPARAPRASVPSRGPLRLGVAVVGVALLSGCLGGDVPSDPETQSLEIVVGNTDPEHGPCGLNVEQVGAGSHDVVPISVAGDATVRILDPSGAVVFSRAIGEHPAQGGGHEVLEEEVGVVRLEAGDHRVECSSTDGTHTAALLVVPARPGYEEGGTG